MFDAEDISLYRCPQNPSVRRCLSRGTVICGSVRPADATAVAYSVCVPT